MSIRTVSPDDLTRLERERREADRTYHDALARLDAATLQPPAAPPPPADGGVAALEALAGVSSAPAGAGAPRWRRWLLKLAARVARPALRRQEAFNRALVEHLADRAAARRGERGQAAEPVRGPAAPAADFQSRLVQYCRQITPYVDAKDREVSGVLRRVSEDNAVRASELAAAIERLTAAQRGLSESVGILQASTRAAAREIGRLRGPDDEPSPREAAEAPAPPAAGDVLAGADAYKYVSFEDAFRGSQDDVRARQQEYLQYFEGAADVLDVGCGRGEFLDLLRERRIPARGIDANAEMVERCRERGVEASRADALSHVAALPDGSLGGLFAAQVVEHLDAGYLVRLLEQAHRTLRPGSRVVLETINPASWVAFFSAYLRDVTHRQPLHPDTLSYLLRASGFVEVEVIYRSPLPAAAKLLRAAADPATADGAAVRTLAETFNRNVDRLNALLFADQDYAAVATRH